MDQANAGSRSGPRPGFGAEPGDAADTGASIETLLGRVFLTPRVVDERALEEFGAALRTLVREAHAREESLRRTGVEVKGIAEQLAKASASLREDLAGRASPGATEELRTLVRVEVERALAGRGVPGPGASTDPRAADDAATDVVRRASEAIERTAADAIVRLTALAQQTEAAAAGAQQAAGETEARVEALLRTLEARAAEVTIAADAARSGADDAASRLEREAREAATVLGAALSEFERRAQTVTTGLEAALLDFARRQDEASTVVRLRTDDALREATITLETRAEAARRTGDALAALVTRAEQVGRALHALSREGPAKG